MLTYVLDASALLRLIDSEAGAQRVRAILEDSIRGVCKVEMSPVNWGEVTYNLSRRSNSQRLLELAFAIFSQHVFSPPTTSSQADRAGALKLRYKIPYADAFALELLGADPHRVLVTGDFDFKSADRSFAIEFLPAKPKP
jgi:predicted nucleic acid-binding protein